VSALAAVNVELLNSAPHMPMCSGTCGEVEQTHTGDGLISHGDWWATVAPTGTADVVHVRLCVHPVSDSPDIYVGRLDLLDHEGLHVGQPAIVVNGLPEDGSVEATRAFARALDRAAAVLEEITHGGAR
jgi:hypothetical protein